jgi:hypothetical protein
MDDLDGYFEAFQLSFCDPARRIVWTVQKVIAFAWLPINPDDQPIVGGVLQVAKKRFWRPKQIISDFVDDVSKRGVPFDIESKSFDMSGAAFRRYNAGQIANITFVNDAVYRHFARILRPI